MMGATGSVAGGTSMNKKGSLEDPDDGQIYEQMRSMTAGNQKLIQDRRNLESCMR